MHRLQRFVGAGLAQFTAHEVAEPLYQLEQDERILVQALLLRGTPAAELVSGRHDKVKDLNS
jgi:hypothetical protein